MIGGRFWLAVGIIALLSACAAPKLPPALAEPAKIDREKHLPTDNDVGRRDLVGNLLLACSYQQPPGAELAWFLTLTQERRDQVVAELNLYTFVLDDKVKVKARITDDYDMRWAFADARPKVLEIKPPSELTGATKSLQATAIDCRVVPKPREENDRRRFTVKFSWMPNPEIVRDANCTFQLAMDYSADPIWADNIPRRVNALDAIDSVTLLRDGSTLMTIKSEKETFARMLSVNGAAPAYQVTARPGDTISIVLLDLMGAGASWYVYQGVHNGNMQFKSCSWFYGIGPESQIVLELPVPKDLN